MAIVGNERAIPAIPQRADPSNKAMMAIKPLILTFEPTICGVIKFPSKNCTKTKTPATPTAYIGESLVMRAIMMGKIEPIKIPTNGIINNAAAKNPKKTA